MTSDTERVPNLISMEAANALAETHRRAGYNEGFEKGRAEGAPVAPLVLDRQAIADALDRIAAEGLQGVDQLVFAGPVDAELLADAIVAAAGSGR